MLSRLFLIFVVAVMVFAITACGNTSSMDNNEIAVESSSPTPSPNPTPIPTQTPVIPQWMTETTDFIPIPQEPLALPVQQRNIFAGTAHSYAMLDDGTIWATTNSIAALSEDGALHIYPDGDVIMEDVASFHSLYAITHDGSLWMQEDGNFTRTISVFRWTGGAMSVINELEINHITDIAFGWFHVHAMAHNNSLWGWGENSNGALGTGTAGVTLYPTHIMDDIVAIAAGNQHALAIDTDGNLWTWGVNQSNQLGIAGTRVMSPQMQGMTNVVAIAANADHSFAITADGTLWGWGSNAHGQLGDGTTQQNREPVAILQDVVEVSTGPTHTLAVTADGTLWGWGSNEHNQLTNDHVAEILEPIEIIGNVRTP